MSRILMVSPVPTHPTTAGNRARLCSLKTALEQSGHTVYFIHVEREAGDSAAMREFWGENYLPFAYEQPRSTKRLFLRRIKRKLGLNSAHSFALDEWYDPSLSSRINNAIESLNIDALYVHYVFMSKALQDAPEKVQKLLDTHDAFGDRHLKYIESGLPPNWYSCTKSSEAKGISRADFVIAIQNQEAEYFSALTSSKVITVGHTIELAAEVGDYPPNPVIVTVGSANPINQDSVRWFIDQVLPEIRSQIPTTQLLVAGSVCNALESSPGVELLGQVDDLAQLYASTRLIVNPMQFGTGLKIKSIEALGHGRALLTSAAGAEGLGEGAGSAFIQANSAEEFSNAAIGLLTDDDAVIELAKAGLAFATRYNSNCIIPLNAALRSSSA